MRNALGSSLVWALSWALGVFAGVGLGAYLTATSGEGAPGVRSLDVGEILRVSGTAAGVVLVVAFLGYLVFRLIASRRSAG